MKNLLIVITIFVSNICFGQNSSPSNTLEAPLIITEQMPVFKGGDAAMGKFILRKIKYPRKEKKAGISGTCYVTFVVEKDGKVDEVRILRGVTDGPGLDKEAMRVVKKMPKWIPGKQDGKYVRVQYNLPIKFTIRN